MKRTPLARKTPLKRTGRLRPVSKQRAVKADKATELHEDCHGVRFLEVPQLLGPARLWFPIRRVQSREVIVCLQKQHAKCFWCGLPGSWHSSGTHLQLDPHHICGGSAGRSDELTNLFPCHRKCHDEFQSYSIRFGRVLYQKWYFDRWNTSWCRLAELLGRHLPDLITD